MENWEERALEQAKENYRYYPQVYGIGFGSKFSGGARLANVQSIQFFVARKIADEDLAKPLPRFVYARHPDGTLDRDRAIATDVIETGTIELCCAAGDRVSRHGADGCTTLIFRNKTADARLLMLTCSHVVGDDLSVTPQPVTLLGGTQACEFQASVISNTVLKQGRLEFDMALAEISAHDPDLTELAVADTGIVLDGFLGNGGFAAGSGLDCVSPESGRRLITVESISTEFRNVNAAGGLQISVGNLIACKGEAVEGDSGGIVFSGSKAGGIVVARGSEGWVFIHPLQNAVSHLAAVAGMQLTCF